jgi:predicted MPP superfamily phosphohydrolase
MMGAIACCGVGGVVADALVIEPRWLEVIRRDAPVPALPLGLEGLTIAHLSDMHLSSIGRLEERLLAATREHDVNVIAITGDAVESTAALPVLEDLAAELGRATKAEIVATMGNWEHWGDVPFEVLAATYAKSGAKLLGNEGVATNAGITVTATDDHCSGFADLSAALRATPASSAPRMLLTHAPGHLDHPPPGAPPFDLCLAGHTHGGQIRPGLTVWTPPGSGRFVAGSYETACGPAYVSRGIGTSVLAARLLARPELPIFRLVRA